LPPCCVQPAGQPDGGSSSGCAYIAALRENWPRVEILMRADSHYCTPEVLRFCRAEQLDYVVGVAPIGV